MDLVASSQNTSSEFVFQWITQLPEARDSREDWTGVTDRAKRKKLQNRLNQRAHRKRKLAEPPPPPALEQVCAQIVVGDSNYSTCTGAVTVQQWGHLLLAAPERRVLFYNIAQEAYRDYTLRTPRPSHLQLLIRLNALNAAARNAMALGFSVEGLCCDWIVSPFNQQGPCHPMLARSPLPEALRPTEMQATVVHHPWIDLFPIPQMRDNILCGASAGDFDEDELCADLLSIENGQTSPATLIVWGESWDVRGWEATIPFLRKWGWLLLGCPEILESTNYWRQKRGERKLEFGGFAEAKQ